MRILFAASEVAGFAKTGGLADVAASLPRALLERGLDCAVVLPLYRSARHSVLPVEPTGLKFSVPLGGKHIEGTVWRSALPGRDKNATVPVYLIEQHDFFERDDPGLGRGLYQFNQRDGKKVDYPDNSARFGFFSRAVLELPRLLDWWPDVLHLNDWQTGLAPVYLREVYRHHARTPLRAKYQALKTLFTIHNLAYQGAFWHFDMPLLGLPWRLFNFDELEYYGHINFLKAGLVFSDLLTTVSPTYAKEVQTPYFGCGLQGVLMRRTSELFGIVNGVDYDVWNPANDQHIAANYGPGDVAQGKAACKAELQDLFKLDRAAQAPLLGMVSRLADQKGLDLLAPIAKQLLEEEKVQLAVLGEGDARYHQLFQELRRDYPLQVGVRFGFDEKLAHQIEAGADMFLMPSQYEPCGLNQLYSLKYGTVPVVRATGGLADTVCDPFLTGRVAAAEEAPDERATGFAFTTYTPAAFLAAVKRALTTYRLQPANWLALQRRGMAQDWSWNRSAAEYERLYRKLADRF